MGGIAGHATGVAGLGSRPFCVPYTAYLIMAGIYLNLLG
jgi:hypothetical protein